MNVTRTFGSFNAVNVHYNITPADRSLFVTTQGTLSFAENVTLQELTLRLMDDNVPELATNYTIELIVDPPGVARPNSQKALLTVAASDYPHGLLGFGSPGYQVTVREGAQAMPATLLVDRDYGLFGAVSFNWSVVGCTACTVLGSCSSCSSTFSSQLSPVSGTVALSNGQANASIILNVLPDTIPEVDMYFTVRLGQTTGSAAINTTLRDGLLLVPANDDAYGRFQVFTAASIAVNSSRRAGRVEESANSVATLEVQRLGGALGPVTVDWVVEDVTTSNNQEPVSDVVTRNGSVYFATGVTSATIVIAIGDDSLPEGDEVFRVKLLTASNDGVVDSVNNTVDIVIAENDDARGVIAFDSSSLSIVTAENSTAQLLLERSAGNLGVIVVYWTIVGENASSDFVRVSGNVTLAPGQTNATLTLVPINDDVPEQAESFVVQLVSVSGGARLGQQTSAVVTVEGSNDPHGVFEFAAALTTVNEPPTNQATYLRLIRRSGALGIVDVTIQVGWVVEGALLLFLKKSL